MRLGFSTVRAVFALFAAMIVAAASLAAPASELSEEMHHAAIHSADGGAQGVSLTSNDEAPTSGNHQHPDTLGHSHCGAGCHVQLQDGRFVLSVAYGAMGAQFVPLTENLRPAAHLDGLFRPPRA